MSLVPGTEVRHPQWGRGTVLFDKEHCIGIRFVEHGQVNFSQEEWQSQHSPPWRFHSISDLEYLLQDAVDCGDITEDEALSMLARKVHPMEIPRDRGMDLEKAHALYMGNREDALAEDLFYKALLRHLASLIRKHSPNRATYSNIEDAIQESAIEVWQRLEQFDATKGSLRTWVNLITLHNIRDRIRRFRTDRGNAQMVHPGEIFAPNKLTSIEEESIPAKALAADKQLLFKEFLNGLEPEDRTILQMSMDGLTTREIGQALNLSAMSISRKLKRLRDVTKPPFQA